jgi:hypothetical protein
LRNKLLMYLILFAGLLIGFGALTQLTFILSLLTVHDGVLIMEPNQFILYSEIGINIIFGAFIFTGILLSFKQAWRHR